MGFSSPPIPVAFNALVWEIVRQVPPGQVVTYGQIAAMIPPPEGLNQRAYEAQAPRWVGGAMAACPDDVPWQRVVNAQGKISIRRGVGPNLQKEMLAAEGIVFDEHERIDLKKYNWAGPPHEWLNARGLLPPPSRAAPAQGKLGI